jgi:hypothetical protein
VPFANSILVCSASTWDVQCLQNIKSELELVAREETVFKESCCVLHYRCIYRDFIAIQSLPGFAERMRFAMGYNNDKVLYSQMLTEPHNRSGTGKLLARSE